MRCTDVLELPYAGGLARMNSAKIFGMLQKATRIKSASPGRSSRSNHTDREVDKLVAILGSALLRGSLSWQSPWVLAIATRLWPGLVRPVRSTPCTAWRTEDAHVVVAVLHRLEEVGLLLLIEQIVSSTTYQDVDLSELEANAGVPTELLQRLGDGCLTADARKKYATLSVVLPLCAATVIVGRNESPGFTWPTGAC